MHMRANSGNLENEAICGQGSRKKGHMVLEGESGSKPEAGEPTIIPYINMVCQD